MILIAQRSHGPAYAELVAHLQRAEMPVVVAGSIAEAFDLIPDVRPRLIILDHPGADSCPNLLCGWIREAVSPVPLMLGLANIEDPLQRARCRECMAVLHPETHPALIAARAIELLA